MAREVIRREVTQQAGNQGYSRHFHVDDESSKNTRDKVKAKILKTETVRREEAEQILRLWRVWVAWKTLMFPLGRNM